jgi:hypothetical protein
MHLVYAWLHELHTTSVLKICQSLPEAYPPMPIP